VARCRCSWQCPAPCSDPASCPLRTAPAPLVATGPAPHEHGRSPVLAHRRRRGARLPPSLLLLSCPTPPLLFPRGDKHREEGKTPTEPWLARGARFRGYTRLVKVVQGQRHGGAPWLVGEVGSPTWRHRCGWRCRFYRGCGGYWGLFPLGNP
jgi:hypothetical protein